MLLGLITLNNLYTPGRTPLDEGSACGGEHYLTTHNTHKIQTSMPPVGFEPAIPASEWPQTQALDRAATGFDAFTVCKYIVMSQISSLTILN